MKINCEYIDLDLREFSCGKLQDFIGLQQGKIEALTLQRDKHDDFVLLCEQRIAEAALYCAKAENASREFLAGVSQMQYEERQRQGIQQH